jgi:hypothetical protein
MMFMRTFRPLALKGPVGNGLENDLQDVLAVKRRLNSLGLYDEPEYGFTGYIDRAMDDGLRRFQLQRGLKMDGTISPGGETETALDAEEQPGAYRYAKSEGTPRGGTGNYYNSGSERANQIQLASSDGSGAGLALARPIVQAAPRILDAMRRMEKAIAEGPVRSGATAGRQIGNPGLVAARRIASIPIVLQPLENSRGGAQTQADIDRSLRICRAIAEREYPDVFPHLEHIGGGTKDGEGSEKVKEFWIPNIDAKKTMADGRIGASKPDRTFYDRRKPLGDDGALWHENSQTMLKDGVTPNKWERGSFAQLMKNAVNQVVTSVPKRPVGMSDEDYDRILEDHCRRGLRTWLGEPASGRGTE